MEKIGATGKYPRGKMNDADEGEIQFRVAADPVTKTVILDFGKQVAWLGMSRDVAEGLAELLRAKAALLRREI